MCKADSTNNNAPFNITFPQGNDSFADTAGSLTRPGAVTNGTADSALGPPNSPAPPAGADATSVSLGDGGAIISRFTNNALSGSGNANPDLYIFEAGSIVETVDVYVAPGSATGACSTTAGDYTLVGRTTTSSGGVDIDDNGFGTSFRLHCVRVVDVAADQPNGGAFAGAEIDAVGAIETVLLNDAPVNTVPGAQTTAENTSRVFNAANANQISVADSDAGANPVRTTLTATNGTLTPGGTTTGVTVTGSGTSTLTLTGAVADVNTALSGLTFRPNTNFTGTASLQVTTNDQGNTVEGPNRQASDTVVKEDTDTVGITVTAGNSVPVITTSTGPLAYLPGDSATAIDPNATVTDSDSANFNGGTLTVDYSAGGSADDRLAIRNQGTAAGQISVDTANRVIFYGGSTRPTRTSTARTRSPTGPTTARPTATPRRSTSRCPP